LSVLLPKAPLEVANQRVDMIRTAANSDNVVRIVHLPHNFRKSVRVSLAPKNAAPREPDFLANITGMNSPAIDFFRLAWQCEILSLLDDGAGSL
jgi:hypothetical protein